MGEQTRACRRVLFVGNSYTYYNDLPQLVRSLARAAALPMDVDSVTQGGMSFVGHVNGGRTVERIRAGGWEAVVLQDQSLRPVRAPVLTRQGALELGAEIARAGARIIFYVTWARRGQPQQQPQLDHTYYRLAQELGAEIAPVGPAWQRALRERANLALYVPDGSHPAPAGSYLAAAVLFATLTGRSPVGLEARTVQAGADAPRRPLELDADEAALLQRIAEEAVASAPPPEAWVGERRLEQALHIDPEVAYLQETQLLHGLTPAEIAALETICPPRTVAAGTRLCRRGESGCAAYVLLEGTVAVDTGNGQVQQSDPRRQGLALTFGARGLAGGQYDGTVAAVTDIRVLAVSRADIETLGGIAPRAARAVLANVG